MGDTIETMKRMEALADSLMPSLADTLRDIADRIDAGEFHATPRRARFYLILERAHDTPEVVERALPRDGVALVFKEAAMRALKEEQSFIVASPWGHG